MYKVIIALVLGSLVFIGQVLYVHNSYSKRDVRTLLETCLDYEGGKACYKRDCEFYHGRDYCNYKECVKYKGGKGCNKAKN